MAKFFDFINPELTEFIQQQKIFFVSTATADSRINLSPKGMDTFRVLAPKTILWLNLTGSGNETAAHLLLNNRMTIMFCAFEGKPLILRLYGTAQIYHERDVQFEEYIQHFPNIAGTRQIVKMNIDSVQTSCGYAVPYMDYKEERTQLKSWAEKQGKERIEKYWEDKNQVSIDGLPTKIIE